MVGWSMASKKRDRSASISSRVTRRVVCGAPISRAKRSASGASSSSVPRWTSNCSVTQRGAACIASRARATSVDESMPAERNAPTGTSATRWYCSDSTTSSRSSTLGVTRSAIVSWSRPRANVAASRPRLALQEFALALDRADAVVRFLDLDVLALHDRLHVERELGLERLLVHALGDVLAALR